MVRRAAYVLPLAKDAKGKSWVLLGKEGYDGLWSGFGGGLENEETFVQGAARECWEESLGLLGSAEGKMLTATDLCHWFTTTDTQHAYYFHCVSKKTVPKEWPTHFQKFMAFVKYCGATRLEAHCSEKTEIRWFPWKKVKALIQAGTRELPTSKQDQDKPPLMAEIFVTELARGF